MMRGQKNNKKLLYDKPNTQNGIFPCHFS